MKSRGVVGQRIVKIHQRVMSLHSTRESGPPGRAPANVVEAIELENGVLLIPVTIETEDGEYAHDFNVRRPDKR